MSRDEKTRQHQLRLPDRVWDALEAIAEREQLLYGGVPSRAMALTWLVERDQEQQAAGPHR